MSLTDDFVESYADEDKSKNPWQGIYCKLTAAILPLGVDPDDPRVKEIVRKCREANPDVKPIGDGTTKPIGQT